MKPAEEITKDSINFNMSFKLLKIRLHTQEESSSAIKREKCSHALKSSEIMKVLKPLSAGSIVEICLKALASSTFLFSF